MKKSAHFFSAPLKPGAPPTGARTRTGKERWGCVQLTKMTSSPSPASGRKGSYFLLSVTLSTKGYCVRDALRQVFAQVFNSVLHQQHVSLASPCSPYRLHLQTASHEHLRVTCHLWRSKQLTEQAHTSLQRIHAPMHIGRSSKNNKLFFFFSFTTFYSGLMAWETANSPAFSVTYGHVSSIHPQLSSPAAGGGKASVGW